MRIILGILFLFLLITFVGLYILDSQKVVPQMKAVKDIIRISTEGVKDTLQPPIITVKKDGWKKVFQWSGNYATKTHPFTVGDTWRISWDTGSKQKDKNWHAEIYSFPSLKQVKQISGSSGSFTFHKKSGIYYVQIQSSSSMNMVIQEKGKDIPKQLQYHWSNIVNIAGDSTQNTQPFTVKAPWRVVWVCAPDQQSSNQFLVNIMRKGYYNPVSFLGMLTGPSSGVDFEEESGTFWLNIVASERYSIEIQQGSLSKHS